MDTKERLTRLGMGMEMEDWLQKGVRKRLVEKGIFVCRDGFIGKQMSVLKWNIVKVVYGMLITYVNSIEKINWKWGVWTPFGKCVFLISDPCV